MARIESSEIFDAILEVLRNASPGKGDIPGFLTAYQILKRLPENIRDRLIQEYGPSGKGAGVHYGAATRIAQIAGSNPDIINKGYLDTEGLGFNVSEIEVEAGYNLCLI